MKAKIKSTQDDPKTGMEIGIPNEPKGTTSVIHAADLSLLETIADEIKQAHGELGLKYLMLCKHIRSKQIPPKIVTETLKEKGFHKVRIAEINRVAQCGDDVWNEFEARQLSFKKVLMIARGTAPETDNTPPGDDAGEGESEGDNEGEGEKTPEEKRRILQEKLTKAAKAILKWAQDLEQRPKEWNIGNGYVLRLSRFKAPKKKA